MPKKLTDCVADVMAQGKDEDSAYPICIDSTGEKPHKEMNDDEDSILKEVLDAKCDGGSCGCQNKKKKTY